MFRFTIRDVLWLTALLAVAVAWWIDRSRLVVVFGDHQQLQIEYRRLKRDEEGLVEVLRAFTQPPPVDGAPAVRIPSHKLGPDGLRLVPGDKDYQFPPDYPVHYD